MFLPGTLLGLRAVVYCCYAVACCLGCVLLGLRAVTPFVDMSTKSTDTAERLPIVVPQST
jgi:hypothetical protein